MITGWPWIAVLVVCVCASPPLLGDDAVQGRLEEVVVSAQRRSEPLLGVPNAISVVTPALLRRTAARTLEDVQRSVPGLSVEKFHGYNNLVIRGVGGGGRNIGFETRSGVYVDEVYVGQPQALGIPLYDVERIEVLRGPQGYLFGRNTVSGAVNIVTRPPDDSLTGTVRTTLGNENLRELGGRVSGPLGDIASASLTATQTTRDGFSRNLEGGDLDDLRRTAVRGHLRLTPSDRTTVDLLADSADIRQHTVVTGAPLTDFFDTPNPALPRPPRVYDIDASAFENVRARGSNLTVSHTLAGGHVLTSVTGVRRTKQRRQNDTDYSPNDILRVDYRDRFLQRSEELRILSPDGGRVRYLAGIQFLEENAWSDRAAVVGEDLDVVVPLPGGFMAPVGLAFGIVPGGGATIASRVDTRSSAAFGGVDYDATARLTLSLGARYTSERKSLRHDLDGSASGALQIAVISDFEDTRSDSAWTPSLGLRYAVTDRMNAYASYRSSFKSGGWNLDFLTVGQAAAGLGFDEETVDAYEIGLKADFAPLSVDLSLFRADYRDFQVDQSLELPGGQSVLYLTNAALARSQGLDVSVFASLTDRLALTASVELLDATFREFPDGGGPGVDFDGRRLPGAPRVSGTIAIDYRIPAGEGEISVLAQLSRRARSYLQPANRPIDALDSRSLVDASVTWRPRAGGPWDLTLWTRNLLDEDYLTRRGRDFLGNQYAKLGDPRTLGLESSYDF